jgi:hypothetical protein
VIRAYFRRRREDAERRVLKAVREADGISGYYIITSRWEELPPDAGRPPRRMYFCEESPQ